jgi:precorrin-6B methylase 2
MSTGISPAFVALARRGPSASRLLLRLLSKRLRQPHWVLCRVAESLDYFPTVKARLGNGMKMRVFWGQIVGTGILVNGFHETHTVRVVERVLKTGMTFIDVGANVGQYTLLASGLVGSRGSVHSFEPEPRAFRILEENVSLNRLTNVSLTQCAVAAASEPAQSVPRLSLDDYVRDRQIDRVDLIKIDIDGGELDVLQGARRLLSSTHPQLIVEFAESNQAPLGHSCAELADFLRQLGYDLFCIDSQGGLFPYAPWGPECAYYNVLAVSLAPVAATARLH